MKKFIEYKNAIISQYGSELNLKIGGYVNAFDHIRNELFSLILCYTRTKHLSRKKMNTKQLYLSIKS